MFSFLSSEKLGTDCARGFSELTLRRTAVLFEALDADLGTGVASVRGVDEDELFVGKSFLLCALLDKPSTKEVSMKDPS